MRSGIRRSDFNFITLILIKMRLYNGDVVEIINSITPYGSNQFLENKIGQRIKIENLWKDFNNCADDPTYLYGNSSRPEVIRPNNIIIYKRPLINKIKALLKINKV